MAAPPNIGVDLMLGVGGTPEGSSPPVRCARWAGAIQAKLWFTDDEQQQRALDAGHDLHRVLTATDLVRSDNAFLVSTGITEGELLNGVRYTSGGATTESLVMRVKSGTVRSIHSTHALQKLQKLSN